MLLSEVNIYLSFNAVWCAMMKMKQMGEWMEILTFDIFTEDIKRRMKEGFDIEFTLARLKKIKVFLTSESTGHIRVIVIINIGIILVLLLPRFYPATKMRVQFYYYCPTCSYAQVILKPI